MTSPFVDAASVGDDPRPVLLDARWWLDDPGRARREFEAGHLPGARFVSLDDHLTAPEGPGRHPLPSPAEFAAAMANLGVGHTDRVVVYDDRGGAFAARAWWMLTALGVEARILDGGLDAWVAGGGELVSEPTAVEPAPPWPDLPPRFPGTVTMEDLVSGWPGGLVDARAPDRYLGLVEPIDPVAGHIPGARNLPYERLLDEELRLRGTAELEVILARAGLEPDPRLVVYCGSGVTSCLLVAVMEHLGRPRPLLYAGSWSEWCRAGGPVETGTPAEGPILARDRGDHPPS